jgi:hypothetical protein
MTDHLITWADRFGSRSLQAHAMTNPSSIGDLTLPDDRVSDAAHAIARVNHGRWIADCPFGCGGAEYVNPDQLLFFCCECRNAKTGGRPVKVKMPRAHARIEELLLERTQTASRNWSPGETLADLKAENGAGEGGEA